MVPLNFLFFFFLFFFNFKKKKLKFSLKDICGVDVGFENPVFACIEIDYSEVDQDSTGDALESTQKVSFYYLYFIFENQIIQKKKKIRC